MPTIESLLEEKKEYKIDHPPRTPLVDLCTNEWRNNPKFTPAVPPAPEHQPEPLEEFSQRLDRWLDAVLVIVNAPRFRRLLLSIFALIFASIFLWVKIIGPWVLEERAAWASLNRNAGADTGGLFGSNSRPSFPGMIQLANLDPDLLPGSSKEKRRLIFIGDIHGCKKELEHLLHKVGYNSHKDHIVAVGDIVNKGPDSLGVIDFLRKNKASSVRGNHEDRLLLRAKQVKDTTLQSGTTSKKKHASDRDPEGTLARQLSHHQLLYLESFPLVLNIGPIKGMGDVVVVHAGLVPGLPIQHQDPSSVMNMRIINLNNHVPSNKHHAKHSVPWTKLWNRFQRLLPYRSKVQDSSTHEDGILSRRTTVIYGHDSKRGLQIGKYSRGIDSGCVRGGRLTALVVSEGKEEVVQVSCHDYRTKSDLEDEPVSSAIE